MERQGRNIKHADVVQNNSFLKLIIIHKKIVNGMAFTLEVRRVFRQRNN
jgi:hypothetical protein